MRDKLSAIFKRLKNPSGAGMIVLYIVTLAACGGAVAVLLLDYMNTPFAPLVYALFSVAAITLAYSIYTVVVFAPGMRRRIIDTLNNNRVIGTLMRNYSLRTIIFAIGGLVMSVAYAIFNAVLGILALSIWYGALAAYYIIIAVVRGRTVFSHMRASTEEKNDLAHVRSYRNSGILMLILNLALSSAIAQMIFEDRFFDYPDWTVFAFAAYAFYKISMSVYHIFKSRKQSALTVHTIRDINLIDSLVSILALQTALLHQFHRDGISVSAFNTVTGCVVSAMSVGLSVYMIIKANKRIKAIRSNGNARK